MIGYAPLLRRGDLTVNAVLFRQRVLGERSLMSAVKQTRGVGTWRLSLFGQDATQIATHVYGDISLSARIAIENSLFGLYLSAMPTHTRDSLLGETGHVVLAEASVYGLAKCGNGRLSTSFLRSCPDCVAEDLDDRGYSAWRVVHQVPFLDHCPRHFRPLSEWRDFASSRPSFLVGPPCHQKRAIITYSQTRLVTASDGYATYLGLWRLISEEELPQLAIDRWCEIVGLATKRAGDVRKLTSVVKDEIERRWGLKAIAVGRLLGIGRNMSVHDELSLSTRPGDLARRMIVFDALSSLGLTPSSEAFPAQLDLHFESRQNYLHSSAQSPLIVAKLFHVANSLGLRPSLAIALAGSPVILSAMREAGSTSHSSTYRIIEACSKELLEEIANSFPVGGRNWARQALERRRLKATTLNLR